LLPLRAGMTDLGRIVAACPWGWGAANARYRLGTFARRGPWPVEMIAAHPFPRPDEVDALIDAGGMGTILILQRVMPAPDAMQRLRERYDRVVFDFDDAIYAAPPELHRSALYRRSKEAARLLARGSSTASSRKQPLIRALGFVDVCVAGNSILASFAAKYAPRVVEIPTTVEPIAAPPAGRPSPPVLVWMGLESNMQYLELVKRPLKRLASVAEFSLRIVGQRPWTESPINCEFVKWSPDAQREAFMSSTVGLAPLTDEPWTRGKCALRSIAYGGHALPVVASPVGITDQVVLHGKTGFLARSEDDWFRALHHCVREPDGAARLGTRALERVREHYSDDVAYRRWHRLISDLHSGGEERREHEAA